MILAELIPAVLNSLVNNRVYHNATPDDLVRDPATKRIENFLIWSRMGGQDAEYVSQEMGSHSNARIQIHALSPSSIEAENLIKAARDTLLASVYTVGVYGSPVGTYDAARKLQGQFQQFSIWFPQ